MKGSRLLSRLLLSVNGLLALSLLIGMSAAYIDPNTSLIPAYFGLAFLPLLVLNVLFTLFWALMRPKYTLLSFVAVLISIPTTLNHLQWSAKSDDAPEIRVLSFNVRLFDLYNWSRNRETRDNIFSYLHETNAQVLCLQEYFNTNDPEYFQTLDTLLELQDAVYFHQEFTAVMHEGRHQFGIATLSAYPIVHRGRVPLDTAGHNIAIYTDIQIDQDTIRVFNLHLASVHLSALESEISDHLETNNQHEQWNDLKQLIRKLGGGFKKRSRQCAVIADYILRSPHPVIVCGDLNDTPGSFAYRTLKGPLRDGFREKGRGMGSTYIGFYPSLRIDYMLHSPELELVNFSTESIALSDHRPLLAGYKLR